MFTGIVQGVGRVVAAIPYGDGLRLHIDVGALDIGDVSAGDSVAVAGCCLTVIAKDDSALSFDLSAETLACTTGLDGSGAVNLEKALRLSDRLGGHLVSGHVDGVGVVVRFEAVRDPAGSWRLDVEAPRELARFIAPKGSIAVDGASLTINEVNGQRFSANLIPHTLAMTTLGVLAAGSRVNLEVDLIARYVDRLVSSRL